MGGSFSGTWIREWEGESGRVKGQEGEEPTSHDNTTTCSGLAADRPAARRSGSPPSFRRDAKTREPGAWGSAMRATRRQGQQRLRPPPPESLAPRASQLPSPKGIRCRARHPRPAAAPLLAVGLCRGAAEERKGRHRWEAAAAAPADPERGGGESPRAARWWGRLTQRARQKQESAAAAAAVAGRRGLKWASGRDCFLVGLGAPPARRHLGRNSGSGSGRRRSPTRAMGRREEEVPPPQQPSRCRSHREGDGAPKKPRACRLGRVAPAPWQLHPTWPSDPSGSAPGAPSPVGRGGVKRGHGQARESDEARMTRREISTILPHAACF